ncbi:MAG TPA: carbohydrate ABC transporter permease [Clostridia bacterium]|nr:carbohydrate ABC transporter permease [Clostridia bacterium]
MKKTRWIYILLSAGLFLLIALFELGPLMWMGITSIKPAGTEFRIPMEILPVEPTLDNYAVVSGEDFRIQDAILNSLIVSGSAMLGTLLLSGLAAFAMARTRVSHKRRSFFAIQAAGIVPPIIIIAPTFVLLRSLGLLGTLGALIIPHMSYGIPLATLLIAGYFAGIPLAIDEAARIDGASSIRIFFQILLPVLKPVLFSAGVLSFLGSWGDFMHAFTVSLGLPEARTVPVAILSFSSAFQLQWAWIAAGVMLSVLPVVVLVAVFQRYLIGGLTSGALS